MWPKRGSHTLLLRAKDFKSVESIADEADKTNTSALIVFYSNDIYICGTLIKASHPSFIITVCSVIL